MSVLQNATNDIANKRRLAARAMGQIMDRGVHIELKSKYESTLYYIF